MPRENVLYLNFFDDRIHHLRHDGLAAVPEAYFSLYPEKKNTQTVYCFFDEIQVVPDWESFVERMMRTEDCEACITGSSAGCCSARAAPGLAGRVLECRRDGAGAALISPVPIDVRRREGDDCDAFSSCARVRQGKKRRPIPSGLQLCEEKLTKFQRISAKCA